MQFHAMTNNIKAVLMLALDVLLRRSLFFSLRIEKETASKFSSQLRSEKSSRYAEIASRNRNFFLQLSRSTRASIVQNAAIRCY